MPNSTISLSAIKPTSDIKNPIDEAISNADSIEDLIRITPKSFQAAFATIFKYYSEVSTKVSHCRSSVSALETHKTKGTYPSNVLGSCKIPTTQVSKDFAESNAEASYRQACEVVLKDARNSLLSHSLELKRQELRFLYDLLSESSVQSKVDSTIRRTHVMLKSAYLTSPLSQEEGKETYSSFYTEELNKARAHGISLCRKASAIGFHKHQRELIAKMDKLSLQKDTDTQMRDADTVSTQEAIKIAVAEALKAQKQPSSPKSKSRTSAPSANSSTNTRNRKTLEKGEERSQTIQCSKEGSRASQGTKRRQRGKEGKERTEIEVSFLLSNCGSNSLDSYSSYHLSKTGLKSRKLFSILQQSPQAIDSFKEFQAEVFKGPNVLLPRNIEQRLSFNGKYIFHSKLDTQLAITAFQQIERTIRWKFLFQNSVDNEFNPKFYIKSLAEPPRKDIRLEFTLNATKAYILKQISSLNNIKSNLPNLETNSLRNFLCGNRYLIKITDKNLGLAVITQDWYIEQVDKHLSNTNAYLNVNLDQETLEQSFYSLLKRYTWPTQIAKFLSTTVVELPRFYVIPKVHKEPWASRPIVPSHSWITSRASEVVDYYLQKILPKFPWVLDSTKSFINGLRSIPYNSLEGCWLVSGDVTAMYTNIPAKEAYYSISPLLEEIDLEGCSQDSIEELIQFVLQNNFFSYKDKIFKQLTGLAMGTACAPAIANLYCATKEQSIFKDKKCIYYGRYIDDIFLIYRGNKEETMLFLDTIKLGPLKITWELSRNNIHFLDVYIYSINGKMVTSIYRKFLNKYMYIPYSSAHPLSVKKAFIKAERTRIRLLCSEEEDFLKSQRFFFLNLLRRGYPAKLLNTWFNLPLTSNSRQEEKEDRLIFPSYYNPLWEYISVFNIGKEFQEQAIKAGLQLPPNLSTDFLLSLKRTRNFYDLFSKTNLIILEEEASYTLPE